MSADLVEEAELHIDDAEHRMDSAIDTLDRDLDGFRTGRASTALVDRLIVDYYDTPTPLMQMATVSAPEPRLLTIRPWDQTKGILGKIEKAIQASNLGLTPSNDGHIIRLPIPPLTSERREELIRLVHKRVEEARVAIRNVRRDVLHEIDRLKLPEDNAHDARDRVQALTDKHIKLADEHGERKSAEIREV
jgi:ribosome recycling factor